MSVTFLNPVAECLVAAKPYRLSIDLAGPKTVGLVVNKIVDCDRFMEAIAQALVEIRPQIRIKTYHTNIITFAPAELIKQVVTECDAAVCAIGHCGSCTAGTVKDGVALVEQGIPAVSLVTEVFWQQAQALRTSLGWPDAPSVELPYPIWGYRQRAHVICSETGNAVYCGEA